MAARDEGIVVDDVRMLRGVIADRFADAEYFVVSVEGEGIRMHGDSKEACDLIAEILGNCKVVTKSEFLDVLTELETEVAA